MSKFNKDENKNKEDNKSTTKEGTGEKVELTIEEKLKRSEEKLLRSLADSENQRRRFEKEIKDAFEFGSFNFAKENLAILDNSRPLDLICMGRVAVDLYAEQIHSPLEDAQSFRKYLGGSAGNTAIGTSRLGLNSAMFSCVGTDDMGVYLRKFLVKMR